MRRLWIVAVAALGMAGGAAAQEGADPFDGLVLTPAADAGTIDLGALELVLLADVPVQVCILSRTDDGDGATVLVVQAALTPRGPFAGPPFELLAVGPLASAAPLSCYGLAAEPID